ncbi:Ff.00g021060.m01.CDS01 [Fusarium sp. VM40]|nr:Ff.00g021060.m01.CDS01 [Fusarium sp. VM40]
MPDKPDALELRSKVKAQHYEGVQPLIASGKLLAGGPMLEKHPEEGDPALFKGSVVIYTGETAQDVRKLIENDIYATSGVWDLDQVQIIPFMSTVREPLHRK